MPIMLRPNKRAKKLFQEVMALTQQYGEDAAFFENNERIVPRKPRQAPEMEVKPTGDFGSFIGNQVGR